MYNAEKVNKPTFGLLVEYICQGGEGTRCRVEEDAKKKAVRYKEWEKSQPNDSGEDEHAKSSPQKSKEFDQNKTEDDAWAELNEHDKRKEYKRARKVMDALKTVRERAT